MHNRMPAPRHFKYSFYRQYIPVLLYNEADEIIHIRHPSLFKIAEILIFFVRIECKNRIAILSNYLQDVGVYGKSGIIVYK